MKNIIYNDAFEKEQRLFVISEFNGITVDMNYFLCVPSIHATYKTSELVIDFSGEIRENINSFPVDKILLLQKWVHIHSQEIVNNHIALGQKETLNKIEPLF